MTISTIIVLVLALASLWMGTRGPLFGSSRKPTAAPVENERINLSPIAQDIVDSFYALPETHRPAHDVRPLLKALDVKYEMGRVRNHFRGGDHRYNRVWNCDCNNRYHQNRPQQAKGCSMPEYMVLSNEIWHIKRALEQQQGAEKARERAIELAGVQNDLASIEDITAALRAERDIIKGVTKEISDSIRSNR